MKKPIALFYFLSVFFYTLNAQDAPAPEVDPGLSISGTVDAYYRVNFNADDVEAPGSSFANLPGFSLGMVNLIASKEFKSVGFNADLVLGPRGEDATFLSGDLRPNGSSNVINQLYVYWNLNDKITATFGNFNTFLGYEVISPADNFNYSTSYLFSYGPFSHTGLKFDFDLGGGFSLMAGVFNPTDATEYNPSNDYVGGLQVGYSTDKGSVFLNGVVQEDFFQVDLTGGIDLTDALYLGVNASYAQDAFYGAALYAQYATSDELTLGLRGEYFVDEGVGALIDGGEVIDLTLSANYKKGSLTLIPEVRIDLFSSEVIVNGEGMESSLASFVLAGVYSF